MAGQFHTAALKGLATLKVAGAGPLASGTLNAALIAAGATAAILDQTKYALIRIVAGPVYFSDAGAVVTADSVPYDIGETREIRNSRHLIKNQITIFAPGAYDMRVELYA